MGVQLARTLSNAIVSQADSEHLPEFLIKQRLAVNAFIHLNHLERILMGVDDPDPVSIIAFSRVLNIPEARLKADLRADQGSNEPFIYPESDDQAADAAQDAV